MLLLLLLLLLQASAVLDTWPHARRPLVSDDGRGGAPAGDPVLRALLRGREGGARRMPGRGMPRLGTSRPGSLHDKGLTTQRGRSADGADRTRPCINPRAAAAPSGHWRGQPRVWTRRPHLCAVRGNGRLFARLRRVNAHGLLRPAAAQQACQLPKSLRVARILGEPEGGLRELPVLRDRAVVRALRGAGHDLRGRVVGTHG
mmetsp:Transcript_98000/g.292779  ORF Transcript_98000/g.292779 Transcript_98000/m.292779 type:complete len:202 (+) Transcript_98000:549-1154(+)